MGPDLYADASRPVKSASGELPEQGLAPVREPPALAARAHEEERRERMSAELLDEDIFLVVPVVRRDPDLDQPAEPLANLPLLQHLVQGMAGRAPVGGEVE